MNLGVVLVLGFVVASAARDVYFGGILQDYRFFDVVLLSFSLAAVLFTGLVAFRAPAQFARLAACRRDAVLANLGTAAAWLSFFYALKLLEPSIVNTIHAGAGPITLILFNALGLHISGRVGVARREVVFQAGVALSLVGLAAVALLDLSGIRGDSPARAAAGLALALLSGVVIALTTDVTRRMHLSGITPAGVLAVRFFGIIGVAAFASVAGLSEGRSLFDGDAAILGVGAIATALIVLPLYLLQIGISRISALSTWVLMAIGPGLVFAVQFADGRIVASPYTLGCIAAYTLCAILGSLARAYER